MTAKRQFTAALLSALCLTSSVGQARLSDPMLGTGDQARVEARLTAELRLRAKRVFAYVPKVPAPDFTLDFEWGDQPQFVTDSQRDQVLMWVPRDLVSPAALALAPDRLALLRAAVTHELGHVLYRAAGGGGDPAFAELFADVLTVMDLGDAGAVTRGFAVDGDLPTVEDAHLRAFDPRRRGELTPAEWTSPKFRLNLVRAELARRGEWAKLRAFPKARGEYLAHVLKAMVETARTDFGPATARAAARMNLALIKALGYH